MSGKIKFLLLFQTENSDKLTKSFLNLKETLFQIEDLKLIKPNVFLDPFLDVIRSEETTGPVTSLALSAVNKFLSYGLIGNFFSCTICFYGNYAISSFFPLVWKLKNPFFSFLCHKIPPIQIWPQLLKVLLML